jgi:hypothetical protein
MAHKFDPDIWTAKKHAKENLDKPHSAPQSTAQLLDRVRNIETLLNIKPNK